jgi:hypothetical protein
MVIIKKVKDGMSGLVGITEDGTRVRLLHPTLDLIIIEDGKYSDKRDRERTFKKRASSNSKFGYQYRVSSVGDGYVIAILRYPLLKEEPAGYWPRC